MFFVRTKEVMHMKQKKKLTKYMAVLTSVAALRFLTPNHVEATPIKEESILEKGSFSLEDVLLVTSSDDLGNMTYTFAYETDERYVSITNPTKTFSKEIPNLTETNLYWLPDPVYDTFLINVQSFFMRNNLDTNQEYTIEELNALESTYNSFLYNPYLDLKEKTYAFDDLILLCDTNGIFSIYSKEYSCFYKDYTYYYNLLDLKSGLKCQQEEVYETSLYKQMYNENNLTICAISFFLNEEQLKKGYLSYFELEDLVNSLNVQEKTNSKPYEKVLAKKDVWYTCL